MIDGRAVPKIVYKWSDHLVIRIDITFSPPPPPPSLSFCLFQEGEDQVFVVQYEVVINGACFEYLLDFYLGVLHMVSSLPVPK